jgi:anaerobic magnesium-protoporphyrin IX monomethyl ester cyclase
MKTVVLYNPSAPYHTMPLHFLALASVLDKSKYAIKIIDAQVEPDMDTARHRVSELLRTAACLGVSVITGPSIRDAVSITRMAKNQASHVPVIWGGWHPSIYPEQCLREGPADFTVGGQGEITFRELLGALEGGRTADSISGVSFLRDGGCIVGPDRAMADMNTLPPHDYGLLDLEKYFQHKRRRQIDFLSSQGCPYRCSFCADPAVYHHRWTSLNADRLLNDISVILARYSVEDIHFLDENFFADRKRVFAFCRAILERGLRFSWAATSRADHIAPLADDLLAMIARAGLRKVNVDAESGSQDMLNVMKKDTLVEETVISAEKLSEHRINAMFNFIIGLPGEQPSQLRETLQVIREIKRINSRFGIGLFYFTPYPGTELFEEIAKQGHRLPASLAEWCQVDFDAFAGWWISAEDRRRIDLFRFYAEMGTQWGTREPLSSVLCGIGSFRIRHDYLGLPFEKRLITSARNVMRKTTSLYRGAHREIQH